MTLIEILQGHLLPGFETKNDFFTFIPIWLMVITNIITCSLFIVGGVLAWHPDIVNKTGGWSIIIGVFILPLILIAFHFISPIMLIIYSIALIIILMFYMGDFFVLCRDRKEKKIIKNSNTLKQKVKDYKQSLLTN